jgi:hypothetical protein
VKSLFPDFSQLHHFGTIAALVITSILSYFGATRGKIFESDIWTKVSASFLFSCIGLLIAPAINPSMSNVMIAGVDLAYAKTSIKIPYFAYHAVVGLISSLICYLAIEGVCSAKKMKRAAKKSVLIAANFTHAAAIIHLAGVAKG